MCIYLAYKMRVIFSLMLNDSDLYIFLFISIKKPKGSGSLINIYSLCTNLVLFFNKLNLLLSCPTI